MDMGITGRNALVCGASKGLGRGCADALAAEGVSLTLVARNHGPLEEAARAIAAAHGVAVSTVVADITTPEGRSAALAVCPQPDILVTNAGGPPPGDFREWAHKDWIAALEANMLTPIELMRATVDGMMARGFGRVINITSSAVKAPIPVLGLSNGARAGLTGFVAGLARQTVAHNVTVNNILPGSFSTERQRSLAEGAAQKAGLICEEYLEKRRATIPAGRFGDPAEFGALCAFLCSVHAGYITGQNILIDGGVYPGTF